MHVPHPSYLGERRSLAAALGAPHVTLPRSQAKNKAAALAAWDEEDFFMDEARRCLRVFQEEQCGWEMRMEGNGWIPSDCLAWLVGPARVLLFV